MYVGAEDSHQLYLWLLRILLYATHALAALRGRLRSARCSIQGFREDDCGDICKNVYLLILSLNLKWIILINLSSQGFLIVR